MKTLLVIASSFIISGCTPGIRATISQTTSFGEATIASDGKTVTGVLDTKIGRFEHTWRIPKK